jgi:hypothetical protein
MCLVLVGLSAFTKASKDAIDVPLFIFQSIPILTGYRNKTGRSFEAAAIYPGFIRIFKAS